MALLNPSRREFLWGLTAMVLSPVATRAMAHEQPLLFPSAFGVTKLQGPVQRVVSLGYTTQDALLALGIVPVGIRDWFGNQPFGVWPWAKSYLGDARPALIKGNVSLEMVAASKPDLIVGIGSGITAAEYAALSRVAPVLLQPPEFPAYGMPWEDMTRLIGRAIGKEELANDLVSKTRKDIAAVSQRHPDWASQTAVAAYHYGDETGFFASSDNRGRFLTELGFQSSAAEKRLAGSTAFYQNLPAEDLSALEADLILWVSSSDSAADLAGLPMRRALKAHTEGREVFAGGLLAAALSFGSVLSLPFALTGLEADIVAAVDGDPKTPVPSAVQAGIAP
jgi:iron complex transport system substrate-binding protein